MKATKEKFVEVDEKLVPKAEYRESGWGNKPLYVTPNLVLPRKIKVGDNGKIPAMITTAVSSEMLGSFCATNVKFSFEKGNCLLLCVDWVQVAGK